MSPRDVLDLWVQRFNAADVDGIAGLYAEHAVNHQVALEPVEGKEAIRKMFAREFAAAKMHCIPENIFQDVEWVILEWRDPMEGVSKFKTQIVENKGILWFFDSEKAKGLKGAIPSVPVPIHEATQPEMVL